MLQVCYHVKEAPMGKGRMSRQVAVVGTLNNCSIPLYINGPVMSMSIHHHIKTLLQTGEILGGESFAQDIKDAFSQRLSR